jgi:membrane protein
MWRLVKETFSEFGKDECPRLAASLAYYALFSLPALLVVVVSAAGLFAGHQEATERVQDYAQQVMGERGVEQVRVMLDQANKPGRGAASSIFSIVLLLVSASGVLAELQTGLNRAWGVEPDPNQGFKTLIVKRAISLGIVFGIALLLLASLVVSWLLAEFSAVAQEHIPGLISPALLRVIDQLTSLAIITLLFAATFKFLPDVQLDWTDVWTGGFITALLFVLGKLGIGIYLAWSDPTTAYGAAGSLALVLVWIYYSGMIYFLGAEFTQVYARSRGRQIKPQLGAKESE